MESFRRFRQHPLALSSRKDQGHKSFGSVHIISSDSKKEWFLLTYSRLYGHLGIVRNLRMDESFRKY
jgi:hypothetical protein